MDYLSFDMNGQHVDIELSMDSRHMVVSLDGEVIHDATGECVDWDDHWILEGVEAKQNEERILREAAEEQVRAYLAAKESAEGESA